MRVGIALTGIRDTSPKKVNELLKNLDLPLLKMEESKEEAEEVQKEPKSKDCDASRISAGVSIMGYAPAGPTLPKRAPNLQPAQKIPNPSKSLPKPLPNSPKPFQNLPKSDPTGLLELILDQCFIKARF